MNKDPALSVPANPECPHQSIVEERLADLTSKFSVLWERVSDTSFLQAKTYSSQQQEENERRSEKLLLETEHESKSVNGIEKRFDRLRSCVRDLVLESIEQEKREQIKEMLFSCSNAGDEFVHRAREFDPGLRSESIFQALRNVWIINSMQAAFGLPISVNPSGFAYSMLYAYTDNYLDSESVSQHEKVEFGYSFGLRLAGFDVSAESPLISRVSSLVRLIEVEYPRALFPKVYASLLAIHSAQQASLQQRLNNSQGFEKGILNLSVEKGGASVVADAYLAKGELAPAEIDFAFGYGVFLQFIDDLQDVKEDLMGGSETLFTLAAKESTLDSITNRLTQFLYKVLFSVSPLSGPRADGLTELILQGSVGLILESIALNSELFSMEFSRTTEIFSPLKFDAIRRLHRKRTTLESRLNACEEYRPSPKTSTYRLVTLEG